MSNYHARQEPADFYAGLPAPADGEDVVLWVQNSQPFEIPAGEIALNTMGRNDLAPLQTALAPFATKRLSVSELLPQARWPQQVEIAAGKYIVRPRYEVFASSGRQRIAHVNVERSDLKSDPKLAELGPIMGKGHILPAPVLPLNRFDSLVLPTPMARGISHFPLKAIVRGFSWTVIPITWRNRRTGEAKLKIKEMGSRYLFICLYVWLEKYFSRGDYRKHEE